MKHKAFRWIPAVLLAALLAGCGAKTAASARPAGSRELKSTPPDSMHATVTITEQYTLEKVVQAENGGKVRLNIHLPRLESDSADAARINAEIAQLYEYDVQEYADCPAAADPDSWDICMEMNWNASWYGDCVSLVVSSCYGGTDAPFHWGWCFDFDSGTQLTNTQLLERMGADPLALENALRRQVMQTFDAAWDRLGPETDRTQWPYTPEAQKDFRWKQLISVSQPDQLDDLPLLLDTEGSAGVLVRVYYADTRHHRNTRFDLPLDTVAVPADWQQRVLGQWTVYRTEVDEDVTYPEESGEQYTLKLEPGDSPDTVRATLTRISKYGDTTTETRTGVLTRGSVDFAFEGECWQLRCLRPEDENYEWAIALREDGTMTMADMGGNAEYSYISWMDLRRS